MNVGNDFASFTLRSPKKTGQKVASMAEKKEDEGEIER